MTLKVLLSFSSSKSDWTPHLLPKGNLSFHLRPPRLHRGALRLHRGALSPHRRPSLLPRDGGLWHVTPGMAVIWYLQTINKQKIKFLNIVVVFYQTLPTCICSREESRCSQGGGREDLEEQHLIFFSPVFSFSKDHYQCYLWHTDICPGSGTTGEGCLCSHSRSSARGLQDPQSIGECLLQSPSLPGWSWRWRWCWSRQGGETRTVLCPCSPERFYLGVNLVHLKL